MKNIIDKKQGSIGWIKLIYNPIVFLFIGLFASIFIYLIYFTSITNPYNIGDCIQMINGQTGFNVTGFTLISSQFPGAPSQWIISAKNFKNQQTINASVNQFTASRLC